MSSATDGDIRGPISDFLLQEGVLDKNGGHYQVTEKGTPDLSVDVAAGIAYVENDSFSEFSGDNKYWETLLDASVNKSIDSNSSGSTRIDLITVKIDTGASPDANASNVATVNVVKGTPGSGAPSLPSNQLKLAEVSVSDGASSITNSDITDSRAQTSLDLSDMSIASAAQGDVLYVSGTDGLVTRLGPGTSGQFLKTQGASANPTWADVTGNSMDVASAANAIADPYVTAAPILATGNQETGFFGLRNTVVDNDIYDISINYKTVMTNTPSSLTMSITNSNIGSSITVSSANKYGNQVSITSGSSGTANLIGTYTTVGN